MYQNRLKPLSILDQTFYEAQLQIHQMPINVLTKLNNNRTELLHFIQTLPTIQAMEHKRRQLIEHNRYLAKNNLKREPELIHIRQQLSHSFTELTPLRDQYLKLQINQQNNLSSPDIILAKLQSDVQTNEQANDEMIETFLNTNHNDHDIEIFIKKFLHDRQETIKLRCITEKFYHLYQIEKRKQ
ncbi:unnamed protein product [Adineta steineri]|uniref:VPS37 C-terminal domain-containing protein n=1 Tax=Adineta steineri TaxID=433720 RepID=A0A814HXL8_9BILA|nr:unnamed protein product [Adineta steineri]